MEQLVARRAHNPEVVGSNPSPATMDMSVVVRISDDYSFLLLRFILFTSSFLSFFLVYSVQKG